MVNSENNKPLNEEELKKEESLSKETSDAEKVESDLTSNEVDETAELSAEDAAAKLEVSAEPTEKSADKPKESPEAIDESADKEEVTDETIEVSAQTNEESTQQPKVSTEKPEITAEKSEPTTEKVDEAEVEKVEEEEQINYTLLSKEDLVNVLEDLINNQSFDRIKSSLNEIQTIYEKKHKKELEEKKSKFIADGGLEQDFKPVEEPSEKKLNELINKYKALKSDYNKQHEADKEGNLKIKQEVLEEFRLLMEGQEGFDNTFRKFKQLQKRWFDVGLVPQQNVKDLWNSYNYFVDKFNDYVKINRELRVLDLKKNLELKVKLCERAEELAKETNVSTAFKTLQKFHSQWREIGPVPREDKDTLWERFKAATSVINKAHQKYQSEIKGSLSKNLELKEALCEKTEALAELKLEGHHAWTEKTNEILAIQEEWKTIGYAPKKDNNLIYSRFRKACDSFFERKAAFYAENLESQKVNLEKKERIIEQAEALKDSDDWKRTTEKLIDLQKRWKSIGPVPRKDSDKVWKRFRSACDFFFNKKTEFYSGKDSSYEDNLKGKEQVIKELEDYKAKDDIKTVLSDLDAFQKRFMEYGFVPVDKKDSIRESFKEAYYMVLDQLDIDEAEKSLIRFRNRITSILSNPRSESKMRYERDKLINKLQQLRTDIGVWENNIGFFKQTKNAEGTLSEFHVKIEEAKQRIILLEKKIRIIDELDD